MFASFSVAGPGALYRVRGLCARTRLVTPIPRVPIFAVVPYRALLDTCAGVVTHLCCMFRVLERGSLPRIPRVPLFAVVLYRALCEHVSFLPCLPPHPPQSTQSPHFPSFYFPTARFDNNREWCPLPPLPRPPPQSRRPLFLPAMATRRRWRQLWRQQEPWGTVTRP